MLGTRDLFQVSPEGLFKADAGLVSTNYDGTFNDRGFHWSPRAPPARYHVDQIHQRDGGMWMTLQRGTLFTVNKIKNARCQPDRPQNRLHHPQLAPDREFPGEL